MLRCSILTPRRPATNAGFRECNRRLAEAVKRHRGRVLGYCHVNPGHAKEAVEEVKRYVLDHEFIGIKLYTPSICIFTPVLPVVEQAISLGVPILHHAGHPHYPLADQPRISDGGGLATLAKRYPEAKLICAHICGGGDWEWTIRALRHAPTVYVDTSGSVLDDDVVNTAARVLGVDRLLFGCDWSMTARVDRIRGAELSAAEKASILGGSMEAIPKRRKA